MSSPVVLSVGYGAFPTLSRFRDRRSFTKLYALDAERKSISLQLVLTAASLATIPLLFKFIIGKQFTMNYVEVLLISGIASIKVLSLVFADIARGLGRQKRVVGLELLFILVCIVVLSFRHSTLLQILIELMLINSIFLWFRHRKLNLGGD